MINQPAAASAAKRRASRVARVLLAVDAVVMVLDGDALGRPGEVDAADEVPADIPDLELRGRRRDPVRDQGKPGAGLRWALGTRVGGGDDVDNPSHAPERATAGGEQDPRIEPADPREDVHGHDSVDVRDPPGEVEGGPRRGRDGHAVDVDDLRRLQVVLPDHQPRMGADASPADDQLHRRVARSAARAEQFGGSPSAHDAAVDKNGRHPCPHQGVVGGVGHHVDVREQRPEPGPGQLTAGDVATSAGVAAAEGTSPPNMCSCLWDRHRRSPVPSTCGSQNHGHTRPAESQMIMPTVPLDGE